ncbi:BofC C-terminal domain-containing protein [Tepidibacillus fermentans]|uniref:Forespore regulator of the sigma-K checkpoint n=1 Tax=Tepidibacillus fermentans TaxID=1281767 RepID=A0A4R3K7B9_9BACI|nr:BofC C-terminal domain-containing protein [Tepidibacillus fermentans]TCS78770.1 forespore regulator of the sigma-K checkpoint [Tepidibacillus fermentans]
MYFHFILRKWIRFVIFPLLVVLTISLYAFNELENSQSTREVNASVPMKLTLITHYACGKDLIEKKDEILSLKDISQKYPNWMIEKIDHKTNEIVLKRNLEDLAPDCKGAYFGLSPDGHLILYKDPKEKQVIETFFQIDIESLETGLPEEPIRQLQEGIPVHNIAEYNSVLSTFSEFSME